jgi:hypothetical protein
MESIALDTPLPSQIRPEPSTNPQSTTAALNSAAIRRLMDEVRCENPDGPSASLGYDRAHNRHNRS